MKRHFDSASIFSISNYINFEGLRSFEKDKAGAQILKEAVRFSNQNLKTRNPDLEIEEITEETDIFFSAIAGSICFLVFLYLMNPRIFSVRHDPPDENNN